MSHADPLAEAADTDDYDPAALRLTGRALWMPAALGLATLLPYEVIDGHPQFLWHLIGELPLAGLLAYLAPLLTALGLAGLRWRRLAPASFAVATLGALAGCALLIRLGADAAAWDVTALPESFSRRAALPLLALAMTAAGAPLTRSERTRRLGHTVLGLAVCVAVVFYLWPGRGEAPGATLQRLFTGLSDLPHWRFKVGYVILALLMLWPLLVALAGLVYVARPATDPSPLVSIVALYGLPLMLGMLVFRALPTAPEGWDVFTALGGIVVLVGGVGLLASALEVALPALVGAGPARRTLLVTTAAVLVVGGAQAWIARPPAKGIDWAAGGPTAQADALFGEALPRWNRARFAWDRNTRATTGGQALIEVRARGNAVVQAAAEIDAGLAEALKRLIQDAHTLHVAGRTWHERIDAVNTASRRAGLPYYLDPSVVTFTRDGERRRHFRMRSYRVAQVRRYEAGGARYATLHVERLDDLEAGQPLLGFSRDRQPFALVNLAEVRDFERELMEGAAESPPVCGTGRNWSARIGMVRCGALLTALLKGAEAPLGTLITRLTDRHELQHQIDGPHLPMSSAVLRALPGRSPALQRRVNRELSAYTAELLADGVPPQLGVLHLAPFALNGRNHYLAHVARLVIGALGERSVTSAEGETDYLAIVQVLDGLARLTDDALRARARAAWAEFYGADLPEVSVLDAPAQGT